MESILFSLFIYPIAAHWGWGNGWLQQQGYMDFAGCGMVHMVGGVGALANSIMLKPRRNRFDPKYAENFEPSNVPYIVLACLSLYVCWLYFNAGSSLAIDGKNAYFIGWIAANTMISGASGSLTVFLINYYQNRDNANKYSAVMLCNGNLAGLVGITAYFLSYKYLE